MRTASWFSDSYADIRQGIVEAFVEILTSGAEMFRTVLRHLIATVPPASSPSSDAPPALFMHCTTGNNRTGIFISVLLLLLGVPDSEVVKEYTLSEKGLAPTRHINVDRLLKKGAFEEYGPEEARRKCERMVGARPESMQALIEEVNRRWGGPEGYFKQDLGLSEQEISKLREILTAAEGAEEPTGRI
jgi:protein tyrosine/serine phosphatase